MKKNNSIANKFELSWFRYYEWMRGAEKFAELFIWYRDDAVYLYMCFHISNYTLSNSSRLSFYLSLSLTLHSSPRRPPPTHLSFSLDVLYFLCIMCRCKREKGFLINFFPPLLLFSPLNFFFNHTQQRFFLSFC